MRNIISLLTIQPIYVVWVLMKISIIILCCVIGGASVAYAWDESYSSDTYFQKFKLLFWQIIGFMAIGGWYS